MWELGFLQIYLLSLSLIANKSRLGGWDWLPRKGGNDCCLEQKCQFPAWVSKTIKSWEPSLQKRKKGFDWVFLNCVFTYGPWLLFFFFSFHSDRILAWHSTTQNKSTYPSSLAAVRGCHKTTKLGQWDAGRSVTWQLLGNFLKNLVRVNPMLPPGPWWVRARFQGWWVVQGGIWS